jgi:hypothetical protein
VGICGSLIRNSDESYNIDIEDTVDVDDASGSFDTHNSEICDPNTHNPPSSSFYKKTNGGDDILGVSIQGCDLKSSVNNVDNVDIDDASGSFDINPEMCDLDTHARLQSLGYFIVRLFSVPFYYLCGYFSLLMPYWL